MPDLMTHIASAYLVKRAVSPGKHTVAFVSGAALPDLAGYGPSYALNVVRGIHEALWGNPDMPLWFIRLPDFFLPFHGFIPLLLLVWIVCFFFPQTDRGGVFWNLWLGACLHFGMDILQESASSVGYLLFPLSRRSWSLDCFGTESSLYILPLLLCVAGAVLLRDWLHARRAGNAT